MRDCRIRFPALAGNPRVTSLTLTLYIRLEKKCHPKYAANPEEPDAGVLRRIYIRDISRHKSGDISCSRPLVSILGWRETTPKGIAGGGKRLTTREMVGYLN
ncbi:MAG: hypothetical protein ABR607_16055 [Pyrinomonadaceae bacterium]